MREHKVVLISGKMGSGKSTLAEALEKAWDETGGVAYLKNFADSIYDIHDFCFQYLEDYGFSPPESLNFVPVASSKRSHKDRKLLQWLGTEWGREMDKDIWVKVLKEKINIAVGVCDNDRPLFIVADCRFENEAEAFPDALKVRLNCSREVRKERCTKWTDTDTHPSETGLDRYNGFDITLDTTVTSVEDCVRIVMEKLTSQKPA